MKFVWIEECQRSFEKLKACLTSPLVLTLPTSDGEFMVYSDTSRKGLGYVLIQHGNVIAYHIFVNKNGDLFKSIIVSIQIQSEYTFLFKLLFRIHSRDSESGQFRSQTEAIISGSKASNEPRFWLRAVSDWSFGHSIHGLKSKLDFHLFAIFV